MVNDIYYDYLGNQYKEVDRTKSHITFLVNEKDLEMRTKAEVDYMVQNHELRLFDLTWSDVWKHWEETKPKWPEIHNLKEFLSLNYKIAKK
jgi:hypothetical protein